MRFHTASVDKTHSQFEKAAIRRLSGRNVCNLSDTGHPTYTTQSAGLADDLPVGDCLDRLLVSGTCR